MLIGDVIMEINDSTHFTQHNILDLLEELGKANIVKMQLLTALQRQLPLSITISAPEEQTDRDSPKAILTDAIIMLNRTLAKDAALVTALKTASDSDNMRNIDFDPTDALQIITKIKTLLGR